MKPSAVGSTSGVAHYTRASKSASVAELAAHPRDQWFSKLGSIMAQFLGVPSHVLIPGIDGQVRQTDVRDRQTCEIDLVEIGIR